VAQYRYLGAARMILVVVEFFTQIANADCSTMVEKKWDQGNLVKCVSKDLRCALGAGETRMRQEEPSTERKIGDITVVKDGWFWIIDRKKELIKVDALQVAPAELEAFLLENEHIADTAVVKITLQAEEWPRGYITLKNESKGRVSLDC